MRVEGGGIAGRTWPCVICLRLGAPYCSTTKYAGIYRLGRGTSAKVSGSIHSRSLPAWKCWLALVLGLMESKRVVPNCSPLLNESG